MFDIEKIMAIDWCEFGDSGEDFVGWENMSDLDISMYLLRFELDPNQHKLLH